MVPQRAREGALVKIHQAAVDSPRGMSVQFFGQFLVSSGEISEAALLEALDLQSERNRKLGEWASWSGYLTEAQAERINLAQRRTDRLFGELAIELELLTSGQVSELLQRQEAAQLRVGEALVELGALDRDRLKGLLDRFEAEQSSYAPENRVLPEALRRVAIAERTLELLPKLSLRALNAPAKTGSDQPWEGTSEFAHAATLSVGGVAGLDLALATDRSSAEAIAMALVGVPEEDPEQEWLAHGLGELLHALVENVISNLGDDGIHLEVGTAREGVRLKGGHAFELIFHYGRGLLILSSPAQDA